MPKSFDIEIMSVGVWNNIPFTLNHLKEMAVNFQALKNIIKPPIKLGHSKDETGKPALGWVSDLKVKGQKLFATVSDIPDKLLTAIRAKAYRRVSLEMFNNYEYSGKKYGRVLSALALLGTEMPAVKDLEDLQAYLTQNSKTGTFESVSVFTSELDVNSFGTENKTGNKEDLDMPTIEELTAKIDQISTDLGKVSKANKDLAAENVDLKTKLADQEKTIKASAEKEAKAFKAQTIETLKTFCEKMVKEGKMLPAQRDLLFKDDTAKLVFSDDNASAMITFDQFKEFVELGGKILEKKQKTFSNDKTKNEVKGTIGEKVDQLTKQYMKDNKVDDYETALNAVLDENPELAEKFTDDYQAVIDSGDDDD